MTLERLGHQIRRHITSLVAFWRSEHQMAICDLDLISHMQPTGVKVDLVNRKPKDLALPEPTSSAEIHMAW